MTSKYRAWRGERERLEIALLYILGYESEFIANIYNCSKVLPGKCAGYFWLRTPYKRRKQCLLPSLAKPGENKRNSNELPSSGPPGMS